MTTDSLPIIISKLQASAESATAAYPRFRQLQLGKLYDALSTNKDALIEALRADLGRTVTEATIEVGFALREARTWFYASDFARLQREEQDQRKAGVVCRPTGLVVVVVEQSAPLFSLAVQLSAAIGAGNVVLSLLTSRTDKLNKILLFALASLDRSCFAFLPVSSNDMLAKLITSQPNLVIAPSPTQDELALAAQHSVQIISGLRPGAVVIVGRSFFPAEVHKIARLIVRGKFFASGRLAGSVEKVLVHQDRAGDLVDALLEETTRAFGANAALSEDYGRVVDGGEADRLQKLLVELVGSGDGKIICGGSEQGSATSLISPTIVEGAKGLLLRTAVQGPILPLATFVSLEGALALLEQTRSDVVYAFASSTELEYLAKESRVAVLYDHDIPLEALYQPLPPHQRSRSPFDAETMILCPSLAPTSLLFPPFTASSHLRITSLFPREKKLIVKRKPHSTPFLRSFFPQGLLLIVGSLAAVVLGSASVGGYKGVRWLISTYSLK